jgi:hypothetical protein
MKAASFVLIASRMGIMRDIKCYIRRPMEDAVTVEMQKHGTLKDFANSIQEKCRIYIYTLERYQLFALLCKSSFIYTLGSNSGRRTRTYKM